MKERKEGSKKKERREKTDIWKERKIERKKDTKREHKRERERKE